MSAGKEGRSVVAIEPETGDIVLELQLQGRTWMTTIAGDSWVTAIEAAVLCEVSRSTIYNWASKPQSYWRAQAKLEMVDGRIELAELRRFVNGLGHWWGHGKKWAGLMRSRGPVREVKRGAAR